MERLDFASIMAVLRRNISEDICPNQLDLIEALFRDMGYNPDACMEFDNGLVCRWMNGLAKLSPKITTFYQDNYNQRKEYLCIRDGEERGFTGLEFKSAQKEGWEKQYQYKVGRKKEYMTPSAAEAAGYERASKTPKSTRFGRQNPIAARWNSDEQLVLWRSAWADVTNRHLERIGAEARIDHRSHAERGLLEQPTVHVGVAARAMERQGIIADRCELNRKIKADNAFLRELRKQVEKIAQAVMDTIPAIARGLEAMRQKMVIYRYQFLHFRSARWQAADELRDVKPDLKRFDELVAEIKSKTRERKSLTDEKKQIPMWNLLKKNELTKRITQLTEELEELRTTIPVDEKLFAADSRCMTNLKSATLGLYEKGTGRGVVCNIEEFPYTLLWSKKGMPRFVCIEPWQSLPSCEGGSTKWDEKPAAAVLKPGEAWSATLSTSFVR